MRQLGAQLMHRPLLSALVAGAVLALASAAAANAAPTEGYSVVNIPRSSPDPYCAANPGFPCPKGNRPLGINNNGDVVGWQYYTWDASVRGFVFAANGAMTGIPSLGGWSRDAYAISDADTVV